MALQQINIGHTANDRGGDPLRTAFQKVNDNFTELYSNLGGVAVAISDTPPSGSINGSLWWDSVDGNLYVKYNTSWVEASTPTINLDTLKSVAADSTSFSDFQARIAAL